VPPGSLIYNPVNLEELWPALMRFAMFRNFTTSKSQPEVRESPIPSETFSMYA
jgi:hypothetical protein